MIIKYIIILSDNLKYHLIEW